jgi:hypothetical protein
MKKLLIFLLLINSVNAYSITFQVLNYNTLAPIENANITLTNSTMEISALSDIHGVHVFYLTDNYTIDIWKSGYAPYDGNLNITNDTQKDIYLMSLSTEGIVKINIVDLSMSEHNSAIYFSNGRLKEIYPLNDTWELHNNLNYSWSPMINKMDLISNPTGLSRYIFMFAGVIISLLTFGFIALTSLFLLYLGVKNVTK